MTDFKLTLEDQNDLDKWQGVKCMFPVYSLNPHDSLSDSPLNIVGGPQNSRLTIIAEDDEYMGYMVMFICAFTHVL